MGVKDIPLHFNCGTYDYNLEEFRSDLFRSIKQWINEQYPRISKEFKENLTIDTFNLYYDVIYTMAINRPLEDLADYYDEFLPEGQLKTAITNYQNLEDVGLNHEFAVKLLGEIIDGQVYDCVAIQGIDNDTVYNAFWDFENVGPVC